MYRIKLLLVIVVAMWLAGCWTLSIHPLYTEKDLIFEPSLVGVWEDPNDPDADTWTFFKAEGKSYRLVIRENKASKPPKGKGEIFLQDGHVSHGVFEVHLLKLGEYLFLDLYPEEPKNGNDFYISHVIPAHSFARVSIEGNILVLSRLDTEWLEEKIEKKEVNIKHESRDYLLALTASTEELQAFVLEYAEEAFEEEADVLHRL